jgi:hypothetical protein
MLQFLLAATFLIIPVVAHVYGTNAQRAAEAEVVKQSFPAGTLARHKVKFEESAIDMLFPFAIALCLATLASLNLAGLGVGRNLTWIAQPILLVGGGITTAGQVFPVQYIEWAFKKAGDATLRDVNVKAFVDAAQAAFPAWLRPLVVARFVLVTVGSLLVIVLLAVPSANAYFR